MWDTIAARLGRINVRSAGITFFRQMDPQYQESIHRAVRRNVLGCTMAAAAREDVLRGKVWAYRDEQRRRSERQKDLADILRMIEAHPEIKDRLSPEVRSLAQ